MAELVQGDGQPDYTGTGGVGVNDTSARGITEDEHGSGGVTIKDLGAGADVIVLPNLPTTNPHVAGQLYSNSGVVTVSAG